MTVRPRNDGIDIRGALRERTERVPLRALERRGYRSVQVLDMRTIERIVGEAVEQCLIRRGEALDAAARAELEREAKAEFLQLLAEHKRVLAAKTEAERRRAELEHQLGELRRELARQTDELRREQSRNVAEVEISPAAFAELETRLRALFDELMNEQERRSLAELGPRALRGLSQFERELAAMLDRLLAELRERYLSQERREHERKVELLERRIAKLNRALQETEHQLRRVVEMKAIDPGVASIYDSVQGLDLADPLYGRKKELLHEIFLQNLALQHREVRPEDLVPPAPAPPGQPAPAALDFAEPLDPVTTETAF
ncbi:MAG: hypothetical protein KatS3mg102_2985 [Planctomycetota bacterium]|nr:MAG: hypothetical protein KatS3mg102_2985 [Planctomycetota bacterium]